MRGIPSLPTPLPSTRGITPAHAGNTVALAVGQSAERDHPRACGEYRYDVRGMEISSGSPPRMRGILQLIFAEFFVTGITPAHAGNTVGLINALAVSKDHPRACGEYLCSWKIIVVIVGSPPRMRGIPVSIHR